MSELSDSGLPAVQRLVTGHNLVVDGGTLISDGS